MQKEKLKIKEQFTIIQNDLFSFFGMEMELDFVLY